MLEGLAAPGLSDFSWPWPFRQSPQTHTLGALHGLFPCFHRTGWLHRPLRPSKLRVTKPWSAELERRARGTPTPRHSLSLPILCRHRVRIAVGARTASLAASAIACESRRCSTYGFCHGSEVPGPSPQASRPGPPSPAPIRACGPVRAPRKWASGPEEPGPRSQLPSRSGLQGHSLGAAPLRAPAGPLRTYLPRQVSRLQPALPPPPSALTWVSGERLAGARHGSPLGTHFLAPRSAAAHLAEAPPSPGLGQESEARRGAARSQCSGPLSSVVRCPGSL